MRGDSMAKKINTYTQNNSETICPHCGDKKTHDPWDLAREDENWNEIKCDLCEKKYIAKVNVYIARTSYKIDDFFINRI